MRRMTFIRARLTIGLGILSLVVYLSGCAAIQGAQGDAAVAKETGAAQTAETKEKLIDTETIVPPTQPPTAGQSAVSGAAKMIAPLH
jgi:hypothetical protein